jgi:NodT family efflux transporter outer membrane factor (OMF) lipoprotein
MTVPTVFRRLPLLAALLLAGCAGTTALQPPPPLADQAPAQWRAPLPHAGQPAALAQWWQSFGDPDLVRLVEAAQAASPTLAQARGRIAAARLERTQAGAALQPRVDGTGSASRGISTPIFPTPATTLSAGLQASWEVDLFGRLDAGRTAAQERLLGAQAGWHEARVSVAAEAANAWFSLRACRALEQVARDDAASRTETARLVQVAARAGLQSTANAALADASAADGALRLAQQQARCSVEVKALVQLTALPEDAIAAMAATAERPLPAPPAIDALPARLLAQRPDVYAAEREVVAAAADVSAADAARLPRVSLTGNVARVRFAAGGDSRDLTTWSAGPLQVTLPLLDGGVVAAGREAARVRYDTAVAAYQARLRQAVREVEEALVTLDSTRRREADARRAVDGLRTAFTAAEARWRSGLGSLGDLEEQRRQALSALNALVSLQQERAGALVALYRAAGGGWAREDALAAAPTPETR